MFCIASLSYKIEKIIESILLHQMEVEFNDNNSRIVAFTAQYLLEYENKGQAVHPNPLS